MALPWLLEQCLHQSYRRKHKGKDLFVSCHILSKFKDSLCEEKKDVPSTNFLLALVRLAPGGIPLAVFPLMQARYQPPRV